MWNVQIGVRMREIWLIQDLHAEHTGLTGAPDRSDRCPRVRTKTRSPNRFRLVKGFPCGARPPHPINIKGHGRLRDPIDKINLLLYFYLFLLPYTFPIYYLLFLLRLYVDRGRSRWPCRPQPYVRRLDWILSGDVRRSSAGSPRQRSNLWPSPVWPCAKVWPVTHTGLTGAYAKVLQQAPLRLLLCQQNGLVGQNI
jgi:hypothetical protein